MLHFNPHILRNDSLRPHDQETYHPPRSEKMSEREENNGGLSPIACFQWNLRGFLFLRHWRWCKALGGGIVMANFVMTP